MATPVRKLFARKHIWTYFSKYAANIVKTPRYRNLILAMGSGVAGFSFVAAFPKRLLAKQENSNVSRESESEQMMGSREMRFRLFASAEYDGHVYMTPQDFLESLIDEDPRPRIGRLKLSKADVDRMLNRTPARKKGNTHLFRKLHDQGIISYTEYLFLLCVLTKPHSGFRIAFNMFDTDGNERVDKNEFLVIRDLLSGWRRKHSKKEYIPNNHEEQSALERIFMQAGKKEPVIRESSGEHKRPATIWESQRANLFDIREELPDTTLLIHLFGHSGKEQLKYEDFHLFMSNLQVEVLALEFNEFSRGMKTISEEDFARILLRYTRVHSNDQEEYVERLLSRMPVEKGITFDEFRQFCLFLNNLDDFIIAMKIYTISDKPVSQGEFQRAVKISTGCELDNHLVNTVFQIFDKDGDGSLSYREFIAIMKDRLHRGFRSHLVKQEGWEAFKTCVKQQLRNT